MIDENIAIKAINVLSQISIKVHSVCNDVLHILLPLVSSDFGIYFFVLFFYFYFR